MHLVFFDDPLLRDALKPFTLTRPTAQLRVGIWTIAEKWEKQLSGQTPVAGIGYITEPYLQEKFPLRYAEDTLLIHGAVCPDPALLETVRALPPGHVLKQQDQIVAVRMTGTALEQLQKRLRHNSYTHFYAFLQESIAHYPNKDYAQEFAMIRHKWDIFLQNAQQLTADFRWIADHHTSATITDPHTIIYHPENVFVEAGVSVKAAIINAEDGPVYLGKNATIHESAVIKGPFAMLEGAHVNIGSKIREATTVGPYCKVGGEVKNTVFFANSNKGHEGFLGNAVVGEWCNFGADTNASNLKNNYKPVSLWHYGMRAFQDSEQLFCGLMMGDHSKCGINTMFNTGTVVGVSANIFGSDYPPKFIPSFTWGGIQENTVYALNKALEVASAVMQRRGIPLSTADEAILRYVFEHREEEQVLKNNQ